MRSFFNDGLQLVTACVHPNVRHATMDEDDDDDDLVLRESTSSVVVGGVTVGPRGIPLHDQRPSGIPPSNHHQHHQLDPHLSNIVAPGPQDVLCGRGQLSNQHPGNLALRQLTSVNQTQYVTLTKKQKMMFARSVVELVKAQGGRFLARDSNTGLWNDIGLPRSLEKVSHLMREKKENNRTELTTCTPTGESTQQQLHPVITPPENNGKESTGKNQSKAPVEAPSVLIPTQLKETYRNLPVSPAPTTTAASIFDPRGRSTINPAFGQYLPPQHAHMAIPRNKSMPLEGTVQRNMRSIPNEGRAPQKTTGISRVFSYDPSPPLQGHTLPHSRQQTFSHDPASFLPYRDTLQSITSFDSDLGSTYSTNTGASRNFEISLPQVNNFSSAFRPQPSSTTESSTIFRTNSGSRRSRRQRDRHGSDDVESHFHLPSALSQLSSYDDDVDLDIERDHWDALNKKQRRTTSPFPKHPATKSAQSQMDPVLRAAASFPTAVTALDLEHRLSLDEGASRHPSSSLLLSPSGMLQGRGRKFDGLAALSTAALLSLDEDE